MVASLLVLSWFEIWVEPIFQTGMPGPRVPLTLLAALTLAPLLARRVFPLTFLTVMCLGSLAVGIVGDSDQSSFVLLLGLLIGTYSLAAYAAPQNALLGAAVVAITAVNWKDLAGVMGVSPSGRVVPGFLADPPPGIRTQEPLCASQRLEHRRRSEVA